MARVVNPKDEQYQGAGGERWLQVAALGEKLFAAVGSERYRSQSGSRCLGVRLLCLRDFADKGDFNKEMYENFTLEDSSMWRFVAFVNAIGYTEAFDVDSDEDIEKILTHGYARGSLKVDRWNGEDRLKVDRWLPWAEMPNDPQWEQWIAEAEDRFAGYLEWRAEHPREARSGGGGGGGGRRGGSGGGGGASGGDSGRSSPRGDADADIPFNMPAFDECERTGRLILS